MVATLIKNTIIETTGKDIASGMAMGAFVTYVMAKAGKLMTPDYEPIGILGGTTVSMYIGAMINSAKQSFNMYPSTSFFVGYSLGAGIGIGTSILENVLVNAGSYLLNRLRDSNRTIRGNVSNEPVLENNSQDVESCEEALFE